MPEARETWESQRVTTTGEGASVPGRGPSSGPSPHLSVPHDCPFDHDPADLPEAQSGLYLSSKIFDSLPALQNALQTLYTTLKDHLVSIPNPRISWSLYFKPTLWGLFQTERPRVSQELHSPEALTSTPGVAAGREAPGMPRLL